MSTREEEAWLQAREAGEALPPLDGARVADYQRLEALLKALPVTQPPPGWEARTLAALAPELEAKGSEAQALEALAAARGALAEARAAPARRRWPMALALAAGLGGLVVGAALLLRSRPPEAPPEAVAVARLSLEVRRTAVARRGTEAAVGDTLELRLALPGQGELRLYRDEGPLVARCPGDAGCGEAAAGTGRVLTLSLALTQPGTYRVVGFNGPVGPPTGAGLGPDLDAAARAGAALLTEPPVVVR